MVRSWFVATRPDYRKIIGKSIRAHRRKMGYTQEHLAEMADLHPVYVGELERGEQTASVRALIRIADVLNTRLRVLVKDV